MKRAVTVGVNEKGELSLLPISQKTFDEQRKHFASLITSELPKGLSEVMFCVVERRTPGIDKKAQKDREAGHLIDSDGKTYPADVYQKRIEWRAKDAEDQAKHLADPKNVNKPYVSKTKIPE